MTEQPINRKSVYALPLRSVVVSFGLIVIAAGTAEAVISYPPHCALDEEGSGNLGYPSNLFYNANGASGFRLGAEFVHNSAQVTGSDSDWFAVGEIKWSPAEPQTLAYEILKATTFAARRESVVPTSFDTGFQQDIGRGFHSSFRASVGCPNHGSGRNDDTLLAGATVSHNLAVHSMIAIGSYWMSGDSTTAFDQSRVSPRFAGVSRHLIRL